MNTQDVVSWLINNKPWVWWSIAGNTKQEKENEVEKILAVIEAREAVQAEENERIHEEAYDAAMGDQYGGD